ncbi:hypothetical protein WJX84_009439, partial [Apatococcus fuscideae]
GHANRQSTRMLGADSFRVPSGQQQMVDPTDLNASTKGNTAVPRTPSLVIGGTGNLDGTVVQALLLWICGAMGISRYIFFSIHNCDRHPEVPLMTIKNSTEEFLKASGLNFTIFRLCGFMQAIIGNYAVPILENRQVWGTSDETATAYLDTRDVAKMALAALRKEESIGKTMTLAGPRAWTVAEIIAACEKYAKADAKVTQVPVWLLKATRGALRGFQWARDAADRLAFADILSSNEKFDAPMDETYNLLGINPAAITTLDTYLQEYYSSIFKKLKEVGASSRQTDFYV